MYKVVMADDYILYLDYLTSSIPWNELGLELVATCTNGKEALEACLRHQVDILITDIGMPLMNGLELIEEVRRTNPQLKTIILSCHEDFQFAQRAVKLDVGEYILKESFHIEHLIDVIRSMITRLNEEYVAQSDHRNLLDVVKQNLSAIRTTFLRALMEQPVWSEAEWAEKAVTLGIRFQEKVPYLPVLAKPERAADLEARFGGAQMLQFVVDNALEKIGSQGSTVLALDDRHFIFLLPFTRTLKRNMHEEIRQDLRNIQQSLRHTMRLDISFYIGEVCENFAALKKQIRCLMDAKTFRFYAGEYRIDYIQNIVTTQDDIFIHFSEALQDLRACILSGDKANAAATISVWTKRIETQRYPMEDVRSWVLNLVTELDLKYNVIQHFVTNFNAELLHRSIYEIDTLNHLQEWVIKFVEQKIVSVQDIRDLSVRKEIAEAKRYILMHLGDKISMEEMAKSVKLTPTHFSRVFKKETGETFVDFMNRSKMERHENYWINPTWVSNRSLNRSALIIPVILSKCFETSPVCLQWNIEGEYNSI